VTRLFAIIALVVLSAAPALADPTADVKNAMIALAKATSYHMTASMGDHTLDGDYVAPSKFHVTAGPMEAIWIDKTTYIKMNGAWKRFSFPGMDQMLSPVAHVQSFIASHSDITVTDLGAKTVDGAILHAYLVKTNEANTKPATVYVDGSGTVARIEATEAGSTAVIRFSNINGPITIDPPAS